MTKSVDDVSNDLTDHLASLRKDMAHLVDTMANLVQQQTQTAGAKASDAVNGMRDTLMENANGATKTARDMGAQIEDNIVRNPLMAAVVAFGVGLAFGALSRSQK